MNAPTRAASALTVRPGSFPADAEAVAALWRAGFSAFAGDHAAERVARVHEANPAGQSLVTLLETDEGLVAGVQTAIARRVEGPRGEGRWGTLADFTVSSEQRTLGPALTLMRGTLELARPRFDVVYGPVTPQARAVCMRAGLKPVSELTVYRHPLHVADLGPAPALIRRAPFARPIDLGIRVLDAAAALAGRFRIHVDTARGIPDAVGEVWPRLRPFPFHLSVRDVPTLRWRFRTALETGDLVTLVARDRRTRSPIGYLLLHFCEKEAYVADFLVGTDALVLAALVTHAAVRARKAGASVLSMEFGGPDSLHRAVRRVGFLARDSNAIHAAARDATSVDWSSGVFLTTFDRAPT